MGVPNFGGIEQFGTGVHRPCEAHAWNPGKNLYPRLYFCLNTMPWTGYILSLEHSGLKKHIGLPGLRFCVGAGVEEVEVKTLGDVGTLVTSAGVRNQHESKD